jgi:DNA-binding transcriptional LysR family regulator
MTTLLAVERAGSLSAGARLLGMPLATVSRQVAELESHLGTRLFLRSSRKITLTEPGRAYLLACRRILEDLAEAERAASGEYIAPKGELVVTAPAVFGRLHVLPVVTAFLRAFPEVDIRLVLADRLVDLVQDQIDLAVRIAALPDSSLVATRVGAIRRIVCASPLYLREKGRPRRPQELAAHDCITFEGLEATHAWSFPGIPPVPLRVRLAVNSAEAAIEAAQAGIGLTRVLAYQARHALQAGDLEMLLEEFEPEPVPVQLVHRGGRVLPLKLRAFLDFATPRFRAGLAPVGQGAGGASSRPGRSSGRAGWRRRT